ncbi:uncharacterized protein TNCV_2205491 [Trichonephila clavipes]|nr:uncharacterized protein TNCV_2205491 [Trichonephila clavipes]
MGITNDLNISKDTRDITEGFEKGIRFENNGYYVGLLWKAGMSQLEIDIDYINEHLSNIPECVKGCRDLDNVVIRGGENGSGSCKIHLNGTIDHIISGRAYARAVRARTLLQQALSKLIFGNLMEHNTDFVNLLNDEEKSMIFEMFNYAEVIENQAFRVLATIFGGKLVELENKNKTSKLWVTILKNFIAADRMGDWNLHLHSIEIMIPLFHTSGHFPYAKA